MLYFCNQESWNGSFMARFLNIYSEDEVIAYSNLLDQSIANLPYTLSFPIEKAMSSIDQQQYGKAMNHILDFFEISTRVICFSSFVTGEICS